jgi:hypothetical protein
VSLDEKKLSVTVPNASGKCLISVGARKKVAGKVAISLSFSGRVVYMEIEVRGMGRRWCGQPRHLKSLGKRLTRWSCAQNSTGSLTTIEERAAFFEKAWGGQTDLPSTYAL